MKVLPSPSSFHILKKYSINKKVTSSMIRRVFEGTVGSLFIYFLSKRESLKKLQKKSAEKNENGQKKMSKNFFLKKVFAKNKIKNRFLPLCFYKKSRKNTGLHKKNRGEIT